MQDLGNDQLSNENSELNANATLPLAENQSVITVKRISSIRTVIPVNKDDHRVSTVTMNNIAAPSEAEHFADSL